MTTAAVDTVGWPGDTRQRLLDVAVSLFIRHSFAGTSLQMLADELGFTKAAIYYHFRTREQLLITVMEPMLGQIRNVVDTAERQRNARTRADTVVVGYVDLIAANRSVAAVLAFDPSVRGVLLDQPEWTDVIDRQLAALAGVRPGPAGVIAANAVLTGLAGAASSASSDLDDDQLRELLLEVGRRALGLRTPRGAKDLTVKRSQRAETGSPGSP